MHRNVYIENIPTADLVPLDYKPQDTSLIVSFNSESAFNPNVDYVEYHIYNGAKQLIDTVNTLDSYRIYDNKLNIFPETDLENRGYLQGKYYTYYNFLTPLLSSSIDEVYYITEISSDRTEIRLASNDILGGDIIDSAQALISKIEQAPYYEDFYINFGDNNLVVVSNIALDDTDPENTTVLLKLYQPLDTRFNLNTTCWIVDKVAESTAYLLNIETAFDNVDETVKLKGPNFNIPAKSQENKATVLTSLSDLKNSPSSSLTYQLNSALNVPGVELNTDYSNFSNFIFFSSARTRVENFYYKLGLIQDYTYSASLNTDSSSYYNSSSLSYWQNEINQVITNFDGFEYYLYFESSSTSWPKSNSTPPYINVPTTSSLGQNWLTSTLALADTYDNDNKDLLVETIPQFIKEDSSNVNYTLFVDMVAQMYDEIWLYLNNVTEKYNTTNGVNQGLSKDLVGQALRDVGLKLYQNNFTSDDLYSTYLGITPSGSLLPSTGQELIETYVTASATGSLIPVDNLSSEVYKRLYHNLPLLLKKKGTAAGLRTLINAFGIPDTILRVNEFGGKDKNPNTWDYWQSEYDYTFNTEGTNFITSSFSVNTTWGALDNVPGAVEFRFKTFGLPAAANYSQSLWSTDKNVALRLKYVGSGLTSGSYQGSVVNPYYQYGRLEFFPDSTDLNSSASLYLPFFDGGWWSVLINKNADNSYTVYSGNSLYDGKDNNTLGFTAAGTVTKLGNWSGSIESYFGSSSLDATLFSGSLQEIRYYKNPISQSVFNDYIMNPNSIEGNEINSAPDQLIFRASLGGELYTGSTSIHPKVSGEWITTSSFSSDSSFYFSNTPIYNPNKQISFYDQPASGIKNAVSNKIKLQNSTLYGTTLSSLSSLQQDYPASQSFTRDVNYLEVGYSPQNEINEDIMDSIGYFNLGDYIGDPRQISSPAFVYPALEELKKDYFKKYNKSYNYQDYFRLIKFYDNSLFKLIKDFIPARTSAATGAIVKQHLLERNRQRPAQLTWTRPEYSASVVSVARDYESGSIGVFEGSPAGAVNDWINISQSYTASVLGPAGLVTYIESSEREFYDGDYSGSRIDVINNKLQDNPLLGQAYRVGIPDRQNLQVQGNSTLTVTTGYTSSFTIGIQDVDGFNPWPESTPVLQWYSTNVTVGGEGLGRQYIPFNVETKSGGDTYNTTTYEYTPVYTVPCNITIFITASYTFNNAGFNPTTEGLQYPEIRLYLYKDSTRVDNGILLLDRKQLRPDGTVLKNPDPSILNQELDTSLTFSIPSILLEQGAVYKVGVMSVGTTNVGPANDRTNPQFQTQIDLTASSWSIEVSNLAAQSTYYLDPTVYTQQNFPGNINEFSDYNTLLNNVYSNRVSTKYFDLDYSNDALNPVNFRSIISQSALYTQIQDSNYDPKCAFFETRYGGTKYTGTLNTTQSVKSNSTPPNIPVDSFTSYFAISDRISRNGISTQSNIHLLTLVGPSGESIPLNSDDTTTSGLLQQTFAARTTGSLIDVESSTVASGSIQNLLISGSGVFRVGGTTDLDGANIVVDNLGLSRNSQTLIIPQNYNPNLNPVSIAREAGLI